MIKSLYAAVAAAAFVPAVAMAGGGTVTGTTKGMSWTASSTIVGQTGTGTAAAVPPGNPAYFATNRAGYSGVVGLRMQYSDGSAFVCSGSLLSNGRILTAAHCVSDGFKNGPNGKAVGLVSTTAYFYDGVAQGDDPFFYPTGGVNQPGITAVEVTGYNVNTKYTGEVIDQNDIAVLTLGRAAPSYAQGYDIYTAGDLTGAEFNVAGLGTRSVTGGADGTTGPGAGAGVGRRRQGENLYDYRWGDAVFDGFFTDEDSNGENFFGTADIEFSYISDFDNGTLTNSQACRVAQAVTGAFIPSFCTRGVSPIEASIAGGDSGGPAFIDGKIASVNSYGLSFGTGFGDYKAGLQSSWGELNGFVPTFIHANFIAAVPEPSTWALLILGIGVTGGAMRRKTKAQARFAV